MKRHLHQTIHIQLSPSYLLLGLLGLVSILSCLIVWQLVAILSLKLCVIALILLSSAYYMLRDALLQLGSSWQSVSVDASGLLTLVNKRGQLFTPSLASNSYMTNFLTILNFKSSSFYTRLAPVILFQHHAQKDSLRQLSVWLRWWRHQDLIDLDESVD